MTLKKGRSALLGTIYRGKPINSVAARVMGFTKVAKDKATRSEIVRLKRMAQKTTDTDLRTALLIKAEKLEKLKINESDPKISAAAVSRAKRALERAKWERENRRS